MEYVDLNTALGSRINICGGGGKTTLAKAIVNYFKLSSHIHGKDYKMNGQIHFYDNMLSGVCCFSESSEETSYLHEINYSKRALQP